MRARLERRAARVVPRIWAIWASGTLSPVMPSLSCSTADIGYSTPLTGRVIVEVMRVVLEKGRSKIQATSLYGWIKMKLIVVLLIAGLLTWKLSPDFQTWVSSKLSLVKAASAFGPAPAVAPSGFKCDGRKYCSQMTSCLEAKTFLSNCPGMQMDGDNDGVPCERQWCH